MNTGNNCPRCGNPLFLTKTMTFNWFQVVLALIPTAAIFYFLKLFFESKNSYQYGKLTVYIILAAVGLVGLIFARGVNKRRFHLESCTRCDYVNTQEQVNT